MTAQELLKIEIDEVGGQLDRALNGVHDYQADYRLAEHTMSIREIVTHHCETYEALLTELQGGKHEWGSYSPPTMEWKPLLEHWKSLRARAASGVASDDDTRLQAGASYVVAHDNYHLGQLVITRMAIDPNWDSYSIYGG